MSVSNTYEAANANETLETAELAVSQLDQVTGGGATNQQTAAQKAAEKADAYIRG